MIVLKLRKAYLLEDYPSNYLQLSSNPSLPLLQSCLGRLLLPVSVEFPFIHRFFQQNLAQTRKKEILTSTRSAQHPNAGQNIQHYVPLFIIQMPLSFRHLDPALQKNVFPTARSVCVCVCVCVSVSVSVCVVPKP